MADRPSALLHIPERPPLRLTLPALARRRPAASSSSSSAFGPSDGAAVNRRALRCGSHAGDDERPAWCYRDEHGAVVDQPAWVTYDDWASSGVDGLDGGGGGQGVSLALAPPGRLYPDVPPAAATTTYDLRPPPASLSGYDDGLDLPPGFYAALSPSSSLSSSSDGFSSAGPFTAASTSPADSAPDGHPRQAAWLDPPTGLDGHHLGATDDDDPWRAVPRPSFAHAPAKAPLYDRVLAARASVDAGVFAFGPSSSSSEHPPVLDPLLFPQRGFAAYEESLRADVYGADQTQDWSDSSGLSAASTAWTTGDARPGAGPLRVLTDFHLPPPQPSLPEHLSSYYPHPYESAVSGPFSAPAHPPAGFPLAPLYSAPLLGSYPPTSYAPSARTVSPVRLAPASPPAGPPAPPAPPSFVINPFLTTEAVEVQQATLPPLRRRRSPSDRIAPYMLPSSSAAVTSTSRSVPTTPASALSQLPPLLPLAPLPPPPPRPLEVPTSATAAAIIAASFDRRPQRQTRSQRAAAQPTTPSTHPGQAAPSTIVQATSASAPATQTGFAASVQRSSGFARKASTPKAAKGIKSPTEYPTESNLPPLPKRPMTAWQFYLADVFAAHRARTGDSNEKINVAAATKEATAAYKALVGAEKEHYVRQAQEAKAAFDAEVRAWERRLTPDDVRHENLFRTGQRKSGASKALNLKDPNAPVKPISPFFLYLRAVRADPALAARVFQGVTETAGQSRLAGEYWKSMPKQEKVVFEQEAAQERAAYQIASDQYEASTQRKAGRKRK